MLFQKSLLNAEYLEAPGGFSRAESKDRGWLKKQRAKSRASFAKQSGKGLNVVKRTAGKEWTV